MTFKRAIAMILIALGFGTAVTTYAHSGGTDRHGCHHDRKHGGYHCH